MGDRAALVLARGVTAPREGAEAPRWERRTRGARVARPKASVRRVWPFGLAALGACAVLFAVALGSRGSSFSLELGAGCEDIEPCLELEAEAERRLQDCWLVCRGEIADLQRARLLRYRTEERSLVRAHYQKRDAAERAEALALAQRQADDLSREQSARERASAREHERRMELERVRQEHADRIVARERTRRLSYLGLLGAEGRKERLRRCHAKSAGCEQLIVDLVESTTEPDEQRSLAALHERLLGGGAPRPPARKTSVERPAGEPELPRAAEGPKPTEPEAVSPAPSS